MKVLKPGGSADSGEVLEAVLGKGALEVTPEGGRAPAAAPLLRDISLHEAEDSLTGIAAAGSSAADGGAVWEGGAATSAATPAAAGSGGGGGKR